MLFNVKQLENGTR